MAFVGGDALLFVELFLLHDWQLDGVELANEVVDIVGKRVNVPGLQVVSWVVSKLLANKAEDGEGLVQVLAVVNKDWQLAVGELTSSLARSELLTCETFISPVGFGVGEGHASCFSAAIDSEVDNFV